MSEGPRCTGTARPFCERVGLWLHFTLPHIPRSTCPAPPPLPVFGEVVSGWDVAHQVNLLSKGKPENTATKDDGAQITQAGMIREGGVAPDLWLGVPEGRHFSTNPRPEYAARPGAS